MKYLANAEQTLVERWANADPRVIQFEMPQKVANENEKNGEMNTQQTNKNLHWLRPAAKNKLYHSDNDSLVWIWK